MNVEDLILVSVDDHVVEPPGMFDGHLPARYKDLAPKAIQNAAGNDVWFYEGQELPNIGLNAVAGRPPAEYGIDPTSYEQMRNGCFDIKDRIADMNANGVLGSMCFPSFPQFCGQLFSRTEDKDVAMAMVRAYNDWHIDEWCGYEQGRFIPLAIPAIWDPELAGAEVRRVAEKGCHAVTFSENPERLGWPSFHSDHWDPFWQACSDTGTVVCLHIGSSSQMIMTAADAPINVMITLQPVNLVQAASDLLWSRIFHKFPDVRFALSEGGIGWIPYFLERADYVYQHHRDWTGTDFGDQLPSQVFLEKSIFCFIDDAFGLENRHHIGVDRICWECDYPHSDSTWPTSPELLSKTLTGIPDDEINKMTYENAMRFFQYDPFAHRPREKATVGALRAEAHGHDVEIKGSGKAPRDPAEGPITIVDIINAASGQGVTAQQ